jgi:hypothetical protein
MSIKRIKNSAEGVKKVNSSYVSSSSFSTESVGAGTYEIKGFKKSGINDGGLKVSITSAAGQGGHGSPRGGTRGGGGSGGGGASLFQYSANKFGSIPYNIGASGTPRGGGGECCQPAPAPSGTPTTLFGHTAGSGGGGATSAYGKFGNPGEPPSIAGSGGAGGAGGSIPSAFITSNSAAPNPLAFIPASGFNGIPGGNAGGSGAPGSFNPRIQPFGPYPINGPGTYRPSGFISIKPKR